MKKLYSFSILLILLLLFNITLFAQDEAADEIDEATATCAEKLQLANAQYDAGKIHEIPGIFGISVSNRAIFYGDCLEGENLSKEEKSQAFRLLTLVYLQMDEPRTAEEMFLKMLENNQEYLINPSIDPTEFINLYNTYRTKPVIKVGAGGGTNLTYIQNKNVVQVLDGYRTIDQVFSLHFGVVAEFDLSDIVLKSNIRDRFLVSSEVHFSSLKFVQSIFKEEVSFVDDHRTEFVYNMINGRVLANYNLLPQKENSSTHRKIQIHTTLGAEITYLQSAEIQLADASILAPGGENLEYLGISIKNSYNEFFGVAFAGASLRYKLGLPWLFLDLRYNYLFSEFLKEDQDYADPTWIITTGSYSLNQITPVYYTGTLGVIMPIYNFKKKRNLR